MDATISVKGDSLIGLYSRRYPPPPDCLQYRAETPNLRVMLAFHAKTDRTQSTQNDLTFIFLKTIPSCPGALPRSHRTLDFVFPMLLKTRKPEFKTGGTFPRLPMDNRCKRGSVRHSIRKTPLRTEPLSSPDRFLRRNRDWNRWRNIPLRMGRSRILRC